jgi:hypothetical protein
LILSHDRQTLRVLQELVQSAFACLAGFFPGSELNARLFHGEASHGPEFPTVPVWCREAMRFGTIDNGGIDAPRTRRHRSIPQRPRSICAWASSICSWRSWVALTIGIVEDPAARFGLAHQCKSRARAALLSSRRRHGCCRRCARAAACWRCGL